MVLNLVLTPDRPERDETPVSPCSSEVKVQFHLVQRGAAYHLTAGTIVRTTKQLSRI
jgi:hypothetical protein